MGGRHRMPPQRSAQSALAEYRSRYAEPGRFEDWPARGAARRSREGAHRGTVRSPQPRGARVPRYAEARVQSSLVAYWRAVCAMRCPAACVCAISATAPPVRAVMADVNLPLVGRLLGHHRHRTTAGYAYLADAHLVQAAERVGLAIARAMRHGTGLPAHASGRAAADAGTRGAGGVRCAWSGCA